MLMRAGTKPILILLAALLLGVTRTAPATDRDGQHDLDFQFGTWTTHVSRLVHPLSGSATWTDYEGVSVVSKVWGGRASLVELEVEGPAGHIEGVVLRLYNPTSHQWNFNWTSSNQGMLNGALIGEFKDGRGEFFGTDTWKDRSILVRDSISEITPSSSRFEQAFSADGGKTWETNEIMTFKRT